jgi:GxxExxY protein
MLINEVTQAIIESAMKVHPVLGPGLLERAYDACLAHEVSKAGLHFNRQVRIPVQYQQFRIDCGFRADYILENRVLVELKAVEKLHALHTAQLLSYLKLTGLTVGLLINFNVAHLRHGFTLLVNGYREGDPQRPQRPPR